ncbi:MAG TPA: hypothetical protein VK870_01480 [Ignavibacteriaceae bacterium]|nr:hypothetical protein [Ignavibacteriaceae bacterium]
MKKVFIVLLLTIIALKAQNIVVMSTVSMHHHSQVESICTGLKLMILYQQSR